METLLEQIYAGEDLRWPLRFEQKEEKIKPSVSRKRKS
jgi:hypothetical protein